MENQAVTIFRRIFEDELRLVDNDSCTTCDAAQNFRHPLLPWIVGSGYCETKERLLFVGKPHRGNPGQFLGKGIQDATERAAELVGGNWPYWSYTRKIIEAIYPESRDPWNHVALTNVIKCTNTDDRDNTTPTMARKCIGELGVIAREIRELEPRNVVFYTYSLHRQMLKNGLCEHLEAKCGEVTPETHRVQCGKKQLPWWELSYGVSWCAQMRVLIAGHPERMKRCDFVRLIVDWIRQCPPAR